MLGVAYKNNIDDYRESPALNVIDILKERVQVTKISMIHGFQSAKRNGEGMR